MLMTALSPKARAVVQAGREALRPALGDRARIEALLDTRLSTGAATASPGTIKPARPLVWRLVRPVALGVALVGGAAFFAFRPGARVPAAPVAVAPLASPAASAAVPAPAEPDTAATAPVEPEPAPLVAATAVKAAIEPAPRAQDRLAQEVALLARATSDLRAGRAADALKVLDEHQREFPNGTLSVERRAARAQALCTLKRTSEGRAELARLAPQSPAAARAKQVCDAASGTSAAR
jgi:hypothetical protein